MMVVCPDARSASSFYQDLLFFTQHQLLEGAHLLSDAPILFPAYEKADFREFVPQTDLAALRLGCLYALLTHPGQALGVTSLEALLSPVIPKEVLSENVDYLARGEEADREKVLAQLVSWGYAATPLVEEPGDFSVRGGILDVYPPLYANPVRVEFFGDLVESIREFNPATQRSLRDLPELYLLPISEVIVAPERLARAKARLAEARAAGGLIGKRGQLAESPFGRRPAGRRGRTLVGLVL